MLWSLKPFTPRKFLGLGWPPSWHLCFCGYSVGSYLGPVPKAPSLSRIPFELTQPQLPGSGFNAVTENPKEEFLVS